MRSFIHQLTAMAVIAAVEHGIAEHQAPSDGGCAAVNERTQRWNHDEAKGEMIRAENKARRAANFVKQKKAKSQEKVKKSANVKDKS